MKSANFDNKTAVLVRLIVGNTDTDLYAVLIKINGHTVIILTNILTEEI